MGERAEMEEAMTGLWELALVGSLPNAGGGRGQGVRREAAVPISAKRVTDSSL